MMVAEAKENSTGSQKLLNFFCAHVRYSLGIELGCLLKFGYSFDPIFTYDTVFVGLEQPCGLKLYGYWTISENFLLNVSL